VLLPPRADGASGSGDTTTEASELLALLRGGDSWSTSGLATAIGTSQRTVQRELARLLEQGRIETTGRGRAQRWVARPPDGFATHLLLLAKDDSR
jgi:predicted ArsR family transcriptional regulator